MRTTSGDTPSRRLPRLAAAHGTPEGILADVLACYREHYEADTLPRGGRGIFYALRPNGRGNGVRTGSRTPSIP